MPALLPVFAFASDTVEAASIVHLVIVTTLDEKFSTLRGLFQYK